MTDIDVMDIAAWLLAQYDADEACEHRKYRTSPAAGKQCPVCARVVDWLDWGHDGRDTWWVAQPCEDRLSNEQVFAAVLVEPAPDPAVLADLAAKRRIVELFLGDTPLTPEHASADDYYWWALIDVLRLHAAAMSDRPGYDPSWAPTT